MTDRNDTGRCYSIKFVLWMIFYCYSTFAAFMFQKVLLPLFPNYHGGSGLIGGGDSVFFHKIAAALAESIRLHGWSQWTLRPAEGATGNVSLLAALYAIFGTDPTVIIPVNAAVHATSGLLIFLIARLLWPGRVGVYSGVVTATLFVVFPSALNWYAQVHKDGFAILGMLIIFYSWLQGITYSSRLKCCLWILLGNFAGIALVIFVRPYNIMLLTLSGAAVGVTLIVYFAFTKKMVKMLYLLVFFGFFISVLVVINSCMPKLMVVEQKDIVIGLLKAQGIDWNWERSRIIPGSIDRLFEETAATRLRNIYHIREAKTKSVVDENIRPDNMWSSLAYLPRATMIALVSPFPNTWRHGMTILRLVSVVETAIWYALIPGVFLAFWYRRSLLLFLMVLNSVIFLAVLGFTHPNIGTLYRFRYGYLFILMLIGVMGWTELARRKFGERIKRFCFRADGEDGPAGEDGQIREAAAFQSRSAVAAAGFAVVIFTLLSNVLLVVRDIVLARWFGLSNELDAFFIAMMVPMFLVAVLSIPIGTVLVPPLLDLFKGHSQEKAQQLITASSTIILCVMSVLCLLLLISSRYYIPLIGWGFSGEKLVRSQNILMIALPLLFLSGFVIMGNSILNARQKFALPALAQSIVPIVAILTLLVAAERIGIYAMAVGMFIGQIGNLLIVAYYVRREGFTLFPDIRLTAVRDVLARSSQQARGLLSQYWPLVFSASFVSLALPVNNVIASSLSPGSVSAFNLGTKFIIFFTGLVGTGISTVMLPYFSSYFARDSVMDVRRELSFFLFLATVIPIPCTIIIYCLTGFMVRLIFGGGVFTTGDMSTVARIMEYGIVQLPFFCINILFAKFANAKRKNALIMTSSLLGLVVNIILNFVFIGRMGVAGIALASSLSVMVATALFVVIGYRYSDVSGVDVIFTVLTWLLYLTTLLCHHYNNLLGVVVAAACLIAAIIYHLARFLAHKLPDERSAVKC